MSDAICIASGMKIDPARIDKELPLLEDIGQLISLLSLMEGMKKDVQSLSFSDEALTIYQAAASAVSETDPLEKSMKTIEATIKALDLVKGRKKREKLSGDRKLFASMLEIVRKTAQRFYEIKQRITPPTLEVYKQLLSAEKEPSATLKMISALKSMIVNISLKLSLANRQRLGIGRPDWAGKLSAGDLNKIVEEKCGEAEIKTETKQEKPAITPATQPKPAQGSQDLEYSLRLGSGYGTAKDQTLLSTGGVSARYRWLQLDYMGKFYALTEIRQGVDDASVSARFSQVELQAGWYRFKSSVAGSEPDRNGAYLQGRQVFPFSNLSLIVDEDIFSGSVAGKWQTTAAALPGVSWKGIFAGAIGGYDTIKGKPVYGGFLGASKNLGKNEFNLRFDYSSHLGMSAQGRYFFNTQRWGLGPTVNYWYAPDLKQHSITSGIAGRVTLGRFHLLPFVRWSMKKDELAAANGFEAGLIVRFGRLQLARPSVLRPTSFDPLPEGI